MSDRYTLNKNLAQMLKGGVIMDVTNVEQAKIAEDAGAVAVMALERVPADIRKEGGVARMSDPKMIREIKEAVSIPVMAKARIGHFVEAQILQAIGIDYNGFLPQDSIGVSGGPYFRALFAALDAGKEGARGSLARSVLLRTFFVTAYPDPVRRALVDSLDLASQGRSGEAFLRGVLGAPVEMDAGN